MSNRSKYIERSPVENFPGTAAGFQETSPGPEPSGDKIWTCLLHLSFNFASGINKPGWGKGPRKEFEPMLSLCSRHIDDKRLLGFLQTSRMPSIEKCRKPILQAIDLADEARKNYERKYKQ